ncbi:hypothetical protein PAUR_a2824 [Pseudoalteromonas aurantia 208]|uniref:Uncharacterized protein n=1 Tax=Pseudoalteromonas aurantia 208 TaxID=1314867 RepID=A0ABR9EDM3_9GAMM|nr:hypothetical protein [Pseudoalteromonas aurantia 208]
MSLMILIGGQMIVIEMWEMTYPTAYNDIDDSGETCQL